MAQVNSILCTGGAKFLNKIYGTCTDGTNGTTKYMRQDGTWQVPPNDQFTLGTNGNSIVLSKNGTTQNTITVPYATSAGSATPTSHTHGNITNGGEITSDTAIANGAKIVITDTSTNPKVARSPITFDNSTTNQCLTKKGTWATFTANTGTVTGTGTNGYLTKWSGTNSITKGPQLGSDTTTFLRNDGTWATPTSTDTKVTQDPLEYSYATDEFHELLISKSAGGLTETDSVYKAYTVKFNPRTMSFIVGSAAAGSTVGSFATILGTLCTASDWASHAEGIETTASGSAAHAEGSATTASGGNSHAEGDNTTASGLTSHAEGYFTTANHAYQHVFGEYNIADNSSAASTSRGNYIEIVGNGTAYNALSNARTLDWSGNETIAGNLTLNGSSSDILFTGTHKWDGINTSLNTTLGAKLNKSGGAITGTLYSQTNGANFEVYSPSWETTGTAHKMRFTATDTPRSGIYDISASQWAFWKDASGYYRIGSNGYAIQVRSQDTGTTTYNFAYGVIIAYRYTASTTNATVAYIAQWKDGAGDNVIYQHHVSTINVSVYTTGTSIQVQNSTTGNIQVIMIGKFRDV